MQRTRKYKSCLRISVRRRDGKTRRFELDETLLPGRMTLKVDGVKSKKFETISITEFTHKLRAWLVEGMTDEINRETEKG